MRIAGKDNVIADIFSRLNLKLVRWKKDISIDFFGIEKAQRIIGSAVKGTNHWNKTKSEFTQRIIDFFFSKFSENQFDTFHSLSHPGAKGSMHLVGCRYFKPTLKTRPYQK